MPSVATGAHAREQDDAGDWRERRRRHGRDRHRAVRAPDAAQPAAHLHHRGQRLLRPDEGQFSPTADLGSKAKNGVVNDLPPIDTCALAIELGASFVARSFSGDKKQLLSVLKAAIAHRGTSMIDVISPCVTFNDHEGSTKSYAYVKDHDEPLGEISFVPYFEDINVEYEAGNDDVGEDARRLAPDAAQGGRGLQPVRQAGGDAPAARDGAARRVRDRRPLHRAGQGRLHRHAEPRRRAAGVPADRAADRNPGEDNPKTEAHAPIRRSVSAPWARPRRHRR